MTALSLSLRASSATAALLGVGSVAAAVHGASLRALAAPGALPPLGVALAATAGTALVATLATTPLCVGAGTYRAHNALSAKGLDLDGVTLEALRALPVVFVGALVFGRTWIAKRHLADLFRRHAVDRVYLALVHGYIDREATIESMLIEDRGDGLRGSARGKAGAQGRKAVTHIKPVAQLTREGGATLLEVRLETGRQHQIRIHLSERGHPIVGESIPLALVLGGAGAWSLCLALGAAALLCVLAARALREPSA